jgi:hypothetical protein
LAIGELVEALFTYAFQAVSSQIDYLRDSPSWGGRLERAETE